MLMYIHLLHEIISMEILYLYGPNLYIQNNIYEKIYIRKKTSPKKYIMKEEERLYIQILKKYL